MIKEISSAEKSDMRWLAILLELDVSEKVQWRMRNWTDHCHVNDDVVKRLFLRPDTLFNKLDVRIILE
jgi:hypothetical protein